jgi:hypothetical protein
LCQILFIPAKGTENAKKMPIFPDLPLATGIATLKKREHIIHGILQRGDQEANHRYRLYLLEYVGSVMWSPDGTRLTSDASDLTPLVNSLKGGQILH